MRNKNVKQDFGPYKVITIRQGDVGQFEVEGKIKIMDPGFYKVDSSTENRASIPSQVVQELLDQQDFRTKDGVSMSVKMTVTWQVSDPIQVATFNGTFQDLKKRVRVASSDSLIRLCKQYNRGQLLPTAQDIALFESEDVSLADATKLADESYQKLLALITATCVQDLTEIGSSSKLGININRIQVERFNLQNEDILRELERITMSDMQTKAVEADNKMQLARQQADGDNRIKKAEADAHVLMKEAESKAKADEVKSTAQNAILIKTSEAKNQIELEKNKTEADIQANRVIMESESKAKAILAITDAEYERKIKEAEAASHMPPQEFELKKLQLQVDMLKEVGHAAWKYPDVYTGFLEQFGDKLRLGPMSVSETLARMGPEGAGAASQMDK
jgi:regulator of protease activity HflC (stomatin/prohibitin superfamily)